MFAGLGGWHAHDAEERAQLHRVAVLVDPHALGERVGVDDAVAHHAQRSVVGGLPAAGEAGAVRAGDELADVDLQRHSGLRAPDRDRPRRGVAAVVRELAARPVRAGRVRLMAPARVERAEGHRVAGIDRQHGLELARVMSV
jgi:hypothetical protein